MSPLSLKRSLMEKNSQSVRDFIYLDYDGRKFYIASLRGNAYEMGNYIITKKYTPQRWEDEMKGIAKGSGIPVKTWRRLNLIPELLKASCSIGGWWG